MRKLKNDSRESIQTKVGKSKSMNPLSQNGIHW